MTARLGIQVTNERVGKARHVVPMGRLDLLEADIVFGYRIAQPVVGFRVDQQVLMRGGGDRVDRTGGGTPWLQDGAGRQPGYRAAPAPASRN